jgi:DNA-binding XRE family transcriptional regulator
MAATPIEIKGESFVLLPKAEYERLRGLPAGYEAAEPFMQNVIAADRREMREKAGLTQAQLARKLRRSQAMVSRAENGALRVGERYVQAVARACGTK